MPWFGRKTAIAGTPTPAPAPPPTATQTAPPPPAKPTLAAQPVIYPPRSSRLEETEVVKEPTSYRLRGLDGMRALAALAVLVYHVAPTWMPGGFLGVDVFFVLSGFLITALLYREKRRFGRIGIRRFWLRRFRRLFPAVALTVLCTVPLAAVINPDLTVNIKRQVIGSLTFSYNWVNIAYGESYFDRANPQFLSNMWTLAVEQQFYLVWPLLLLLIMLWPEQNRWVAPLALALCSVTTMAVLKTTDLSLTRIYQGTDTHAFGMMLGASLALLFPQSLEKNAHVLDAATVRFRGLGAWVGIGGVLLSFLLLSDLDAFTYPWGVLAVSVLTLAVIQACFEEVSGSPGPAKLLVLLLEWRPLVWLGERSYSLYLWHWPVFLLYRSVLPGLPQWLDLVVILGISTVAAHLSYTYVESPMRRQGIIATWKSWGARISHPFVRQGATVDTAADIPAADTCYVGAVKPESSVYAVWVAAVATTLLVAPLGVALWVAPQQTEAEHLVSEGKKYLQQQGEGASRLSQKQALPPFPGTEPRKSLTQSPTPQLTRAAVPGNQVDIIGDSVTLASAQALAAVLPGANINGEVSRSSLAGMGIVESMAKQGTLRPYLVFSLATNSAFQVDDGERLLETVAKDTKVVLVTGFGSSSQQWIAQSNQAIRALAKRYPQRIAVADWNQAIAPHPEMLAGDSVHPQVSGQELYAKLVNEAVQKLGPWEEVKPTKPEPQPKENPTTK